MEHWLDTSGFEDAAIIVRRRLETMGMPAADADDATATLLERIWIDENAGKLVITSLTGLALARVPTAFVDWRRALRRGVRAVGGSESIEHLEEEGARVLGGVNCAECGCSVNDADLCETIRESLPELTAVQARLFVCRHAYGMDSATVAGVMGWSVNRARKLLAETERKLRTQA